MKNEENAEKNVDVKDESRATHEREMRRLKKASELVVAEYRETNNSLQKQVSITLYTTLYT